MNFNGNWQSKESNINFNVDSEIVFFDHLQSESGKRLKNRTTLSKIFNLKGIEVQPSLGLDYAKFESDSNETEAKRTLPIYSLDI